jgi:hypothetical protein
MGRRGPKPDYAKREAYARLIADGVPPARAFRVVGVNPRTGGLGTPLVGSLSPLRRTPLARSDTAFRISFEPAGADHIAQ